MKTFLLFNDKGIDTINNLPRNSAFLIQDLALNTIVKAMANGNEFIAKISMQVILSGLGTDVETISYRQHILRDCLYHPEILESLYQTATEAIEAKKKHWSIFSKYPSSILLSSVLTLELLLNYLKKLRIIADEHIIKVKSDGVIRLFSMLQSELPDSYFVQIEDMLNELRLSSGLLLSAKLDRGSKGTGYILHKQKEKKQNFLQWLFTPQPEYYTFSIHPRDDSGARMLSAIKDEGINSIADTVAKSADHIIDFFNMLRSELAFYVGCSNLKKKLDEIGQPYIFPLPLKANDACQHSIVNLADLSLALTLNQKVVGNTMQADRKNLIIITGANQGGKSTFLRSIGEAQLMMQCGMFVAAEFFSANICDSLHTHYKREEDTDMNSGKFDEELSRMNEIVKNLTPNALLLFNESFAATNEREGSEIASQITRALIEQHYKVFYVTHLYEFAHKFYMQQLSNALFLRAERKEDGSRSYKLQEGEPLQTSFGADIYRKIFQVT